MYNIQSTIMSNYDNITSARKYQTFAEIENKKIIKIKQLEKEMERRNRGPSNRLGKNAKKQEARRNFVLNDEKLVENVEDIVLGIKPSRTPLRRLKRKPGHRERRPETIDFMEENPLEFPKNHLPPII